MLREIYSTPKETMRILKLWYFKTSVLTGCTKPPHKETTLIWQNKNRSRKTQFLNCICFVKECTGNQMPQESQTKQDCTTCGLILWLGEYIEIAKSLKQSDISSYLSTSWRPPTFVTAAMYLIIILDASVFPEPLSPVKTKNKWN